MYSIIVQGIDEEIARLQEVRSILADVNSDTFEVPSIVKRGRPRISKAAVTSSKRVLSAEARGKIAAAQKARWAKSKRG